MRMLKRQVVKVFGVQFGIRRSVLGFQLVFGVRCSAFGLRPSAFGV